MAYKKLTIFFLLVTAIYIFGYFLFRQEFSTESSVGSRYVNLYKTNNVHVFLHYTFYPALWVDFSLTGQEYSYSSYDDPFWIFTN